MGESEIAELIVTLVAEVEGFGRDMRQATEASQEAAEAAKKTGETVENTTKGIKDMATAAAQALASLGAKEWLKEALGEWQTAESTAIRLEAALKSNNREVSSTMNAYKEFASEMQKVTTVGDDTSLAMLQQAESMGLHGDAAKRAVKNSIALAAAKGGEASSYLRATTMLEQGNSVMLAKAIPALRNIKDDSVRAAKAQEMLGGMFEVATAEAKSSAGQIAQLKNSYGDFMEDIGKSVADTISPVVDMVKQLVEWFQNLSPAMKETITIFAMVTVAVGGITAAVTVLGMVFNTMFGGAGLLIGLIASAGAGIAIWSNSLGGIAKAWEKVQQEAENFWNWLKPIRDAAGSLWDMMVEGGEAAWSWVKQTASEVWEYIAGTGTTNWQMIGEFIQTALLKAEFTIRNFGKVTTLVWTETKLAFVKAVNEIEFFFTGTLPSLLGWFGRNWKQVFTDAFNFTTTIYMNMIGNIIRILANLPSLVKGKVKFSELWKPLTDGFKATLQEMPELPKRESSALEQSLSDSAARQREALQSGWEAFREGKLAEFAFPEDETEAAKSKALDVGKGVGEGLAKGMGEKFDAVLFGTAEALQHIAEYQDKLNESRKKTQSDSNKPGTASGGGFFSSTGSMIDVNVTPNKWGADKAEQYLKSIDNSLKKSANKAGVVLTAAGF